MGEGVVLDFRKKRAGEEITGKDVAVYKDAIRQGDAVMLCTNWSKKRGFNLDYLYKWPYLGKTGCEFLTRKKKSRLWEPRV